MQKHYVTYTVSCKYMYLCHICLMLRMFTQLFAHVS